MSLKGIRLAALCLALCAALGLSGCQEQEPLMDALGQEVTFFALPIGGYVTMYSDETVPIDLQLCALPGDYDAKGSVLTSAELIAPNGVRYPLALNGISQVKDGKKIYGYDAFSLTGLLELPAEGLHRFFAMEIRYGEEQERVEIIPLGGNLAFEVIPRNRVPEPVYSDGFSQVTVQEDPAQVPYRFNALEVDARIDKIWISPVTAYEPLEGQESMPMAGTLTLQPTDLGENWPAGAVYLVCPKVEAADSRDGVIMRGSPVYCGVVAAERENQETLTSLAEEALAVRTAFAG